MKNLKAKWHLKNKDTRLYQIPVPIIGLTGGIATGKSTVTKILSQENILIIDADQLVKNIYQKAEGLLFIAQHFPKTIENKKINFQLLRQEVFENLHAKTLIENFIHPQLEAEFIKTYSTFKAPSFVIYDVPLLFEKKLNQLVDLTVCVYAPSALQLERMVARDHIDLKLAQKILHFQMDIEEKKTLADFVINNTGTFDNLNDATWDFIKAITD